ncbi:MAG: hypothetical protein ACM3SV_01355 [Betaproteobacteria bacterium]
MPKLTLPAPDANLVSTVHDADAARTWLAAQPLAQPLRMARALLQEIRAIDACATVPVERMELLDALRGAVIQAEAGIMVRYANKPLPLLEEEQSVFDTARQLWHVLAIAYLRAAPLLPPAQLVQAMHRGAVGLREALYCHYVAGIEADADILHLLYELLATAESLHVQRVAVLDPDFRHLGESTIAGDVAWSLLLHFCDPYRFSPAQFNVANRAISRWCSFASFQVEPDEDPRAKSIPLAKWLGEEIVSRGGPRWLEVRPVVRKIRKRIESLEAGETPEQLKLGRELTPSACIRLMRDLDRALRPDAKPPGALIGKATIDLVFGNDNLYALIAGKPMTENQLTTKSSSISHERMALFGFDNVANRIDHVGDLRAPAETWAVEDNWILRAAPAGGQVVTPLLVGIRPSGGEPPQLAVLFGLRQTSDGWLAANLRLLPGPVDSGIQKSGIAAQVKGVVRQPAFLLPAEQEGDTPASICLPTGSGMREGLLLELEESPVAHLRLREVIERGSNFTRFGYART